jgi:hypothetical protein
VPSGEGPSIRLAGLALAIFIGVVMVVAGATRLLGVW